MKHSSVLVIVAGVYDSHLQLVTQKRKEKRRRKRSTRRENGPVKTVYQCCHSGGCPSVPRGLNDQNWSEGGKMMLTEGPLCSRWFELKIQGIWEIGGVIRRIRRVFVKILGLLLEQDEHRVIRQR